MKYTISLIILMLLTHTYVGADERKMSEQQAQKTWIEYQENIRNRRLAEALIINDRLTNFGITDKSDLLLDFTFFSPEEMGSNNLKTQLSENYGITIRFKEGYFYIEGTSKPYAINLSPEDHLGWVEYMCDVAVSHGAIFSAWSITDPKSKQIWTNENIETDYD